MDADEDRLQRHGLANALASPDVAEAMLSVPNATVALSVFEWSGRYQQDVILPWRIIDSQQELLSAASEIRRSKRRYAEFPTALGYAVGYAAGLFADAPP